MRKNKPGHWFGKPYLWRHTATEITRLNPQKIPHELIEKRVPESEHIIVLPE